MMRRGITHVPLILGIVGMIAMAALVSDHNVRTWAIVMGFTTVAAIGYAAYQEKQAIRAVGIARRRLGSVPYDELRREMDRARRHERPFALARLRLASRSVANGSPLPLLDDARPAVRSTDRVWRTGRDLYVLMPETSKPGAEAIIGRALSVRPELSTEWRIASFPSDGVTVGALFAELGAGAPRGDDLVPTEQPARPRVGLQHAPAVQTIEIPERSRDRR